ncbi:hypothetical protein SRHO_G00118120 [Serrasalmus rhombeus]
MKKILTSHRKLCSAGLCLLKECVSWNPALVFVPDSLPSSLKNNEILHTAVEQNMNQADKSATADSYSLSIRNSSSPSEKADKPAWELRRADLTRQRQPRSFHTSA